MRTLLGFLLLDLALSAGCRGGAGEGVTPEATLLVHGPRGALTMNAGDPRVDQLLLELDSLFAAARPAAGPLSRREAALCFDRGALEFRFAAAREFRLGDGEVLEPWRVLLPLGVEPAAPGGESGALLLLGYPEYSPDALLSPRGRDGMTAILEGRLSH